MVTYKCFKSLSDPVRREIVGFLSREALNVTHLAERFEVSRPAISRHLRVLREAGLVSEIKQGRERTYFLETEVLEDAADWLSALASGAEAEDWTPTTTSRAESAKKDGDQWRQW